MVTKLIDIERKIVSLDACKQAIKVKPIAVTSSQDKEIFLLQPEKFSSVGGPQVVTSEFRAGSLVKCKTQHSLFL